MVFSLVKPIQSQEIYNKSDFLECEKLTRQAENYYRLPKNILLSISRVESGYKKVDGVIRSWPWTLNAGGNSAYFETKEDAIKDLKIKLKRGLKNIDLGCMQINYKWHRKYFENISQMMEPSKNVDYAARFLKRLYERHGSWDRAIKYYHSSKSKYNKLYLKKVKSVWKKENDIKSSEPILLAKGKKLVEDNIPLEKKKLMPIIKLDSKKVQPNLVNASANNDLEKRVEPMKVRSTNFEAVNIVEKDFDFRSFVKRVRKQNNALPKYIRDNWTIVVSIRNQLRVQN